MNSPFIVILLRAISCGAWLAPLVVLFAPMAQAVRRAGGNHLKALLWFISLLNIMFNTRGILMPADVMSQVILLALSILCAIGVLWVTHHDTE